MRSKFRFAVQTSLVALSLGASASNSTLILLNGHCLPIDRVVTVGILTKF